MSSLVTLGVLLRLAEAARRARSAEESGGDASDGALRNSFFEGEDTPSARAESPISEGQGERSSGAENRTRQPILPSLGGRLAIGENGVLFASTRAQFGGTGTDGGIKTAALGEMALVRLVAPNPFGVDVAGKSQVELKTAFDVVPAEKEVRSAEVDLLRDGTKVGTVPVVEVSGRWEGTIAKGTVFDPEAEYHLQFVVNRNSEDMMTSPKKRLRPARLEFAGTAESTTNEHLDFVKLFNPTPRVSLHQMANPGAGNRVRLTVVGDVTDSLAPIAQVAVDGRVVPVTQGSSGPNGQGPYVGSFQTQVEIGPQETLILAHAVNALGNLGSHQVVVTPIRGPNGAITGREVSPGIEISPQDESPENYAFRIELTDRGQAGDRVSLGIDTGIEQRKVTLTRRGRSYVSEDLLLIPETLALPAGVPAAGKDRLIKGALGLRPQLIYAEAVKEEAAVSGTFIADSAARPIDAVEPSDPGSVRQPLRLVVGMDGEAGAETSVTLESLGADLSIANPTTSVPFQQSVRVRRQSSDSKAPGYNLYVSTDPILPVYASNTEARPGYVAHGVIAGTFLRLSTPSGTSVEPVGIPAKQAQWLVEEVRPVFEAGEDEPRLFDVILSAKVEGVGGVVPGLTLEAAFEAAGEGIGEQLGISHVVPVGDVYEDAGFPGRTGSDGKTYLRVRMSAVEASDPQRFKALAMRAVDSAGGSVLSLLKGLNAGTVSQPVLDALVKTGFGPLLTPFLAGKAVAGLGRGMEPLIGRILWDVFDELAKVSPDVAAMRETIARGYAQSGIILTEENATELTIALLAGLDLGLVLGIGHAAYDDLNIIANAKGLGYLLYATTQAFIFQAKANYEIENGVIRFSMDPQFRDELLGRLRQIAPVLQSMAEIASRPDVRAEFNVMVLKQLYTEYDAKIGDYLPFFTRNSDNQRTFLLGFMLGHINGYLLEVVGTLVIGSFVAGLGAYVVGCEKLSRVGGLGKLVKLLGKLRVLPFRQASNMQKVGKIIVDSTLFLSNMNETRFTKVLDEAATVEKAEKVLLAVEHYADEAVENGQRIVPKLEAAARALNETEETAETVIAMGRMAEHKIQTPQGEKPLVLGMGCNFGPGGAGCVGEFEQALKGLDNIMVAAKKAPDLKLFERLYAALGDSGAQNAALGKLKGDDTFAHTGDMLQAFFRSLAHTSWDASTFQALERLMDRWATTLPPPQANEAVLDIVAMLGKYGRRLGADGPEATARIVRQLDRFKVADPVAEAARQVQLDSVVRRFVLLDQSYTEAGKRLVNLDQVARNVETGRLGLEDAETINRATRINGLEDEATGTNKGLFRQMEEQAGGDATGNLVAPLKGAVTDAWVRNELRPHGLPEIQFETPAGEHVDVFMQFTKEHTIHGVYDLSAGEVVTRDLHFAPGTWGAFEDKSYKQGTWGIDAEKKLGDAAREVALGEREGIRQGGPVETVLVVTSDILDGGDLSTLRTVLERIKTPEGRGVVWVVPPRSVKSDAYPGVPAFEDYVRGLIRNLVP